MKVAYVGPYLSTAAGSAALQRALGISRSLAEAGATVHIGTGDADAAPPASHQALPGIEIRHLRTPSRRHGRLGKALEWFTFADDVIAWLAVLGDLDAVILYGGGAHLSNRVTRWARQAGVAVVADQVEWYDTRHQPMGHFGPFARDLERGMKSAYAATGNCLTISSLLDDHFAGQGCRTLLVPPTTDVLDLAWSPERPGRDYIRFVYAGSPGKKDHLRTVVEGLELADPSGRRVGLDVYGPEPVALASLLGRSVLPAFINARGPVPRETVLEAVATADYVPLVRPRERFANAGFPTKVVESLSCGTPVICNATSDLPSHIRDGETGWLLDEPTAASFAEAAGRALATSSTERETMRRLAREEAEESFDYRRYTSALRDFFNDLRPVR